MSNPRLIVNLILMILISFEMINCSNDPSTEINSGHDCPDTPGQSPETTTIAHHPIIEIWKELDGSVPIRGRSLYLRLFDDRVVEFDYLSQRKDQIGKLPYIFSLERTPPAQISEEEFNTLTSLLENLFKGKDIKEEYKTVGLTFDAFAKLTILSRKDDVAERKIIINDSEVDVLNGKFARKFPKPLVYLIKEVQRVRFDNCSGCKTDMQAGFRPIPEADEQEFNGNYFNPTFGYSVVIPSGLSGFSQKPPLPQHGFRITLSARPEAYIWVDGSYNALEYRSLEKKTKFDLDLLRREESKGEVLEQRTIRLQNLDALLVKVRYKSRETGEQMIQVIVSAVRDRPGDTGIVYELRLETPEARFNEYSSIFQKVVESWSSKRLPK